jgi:hypothetical protein
MKKGQRRKASIAGKGHKRFPRSKKGLRRNPIPNIETLMKDQAPLIADLVAFEMLRLVLGPGVMGKVATKLMENLDAHQEPGEGTDA